MLTPDTETLALASYMMGAIDAKRAQATVVSGATLDVITANGIAFVNSFLVNTTRATIHATMYRAGFARNGADD